MRTDKYLVFDTETGGLEASTCSLLTIWLGVINNEGVVESQLSLYLKPNDNQPYKVTAGAMKINKINLVEHDKTAVTYDDASERLYHFLKNASVHGKYKLTPVGHNVSFDLGFIWEHLLKKRGWEHFVSYRQLDTATAAAFLKFAGKLPQDAPQSLGELARYLGIKISDSSLHNAQVDAELTWKVLNKLKEL